jgi:PAS domain-containing protein/CheY-like chemotaxis protein
MLARQFSAGFNVGQNGVAPTRIAGPVAVTARNKRAVPVRVPYSEAEALLLLCADWLWETDHRHRISWLSGTFTDRTGVAASHVLGRCRLTALHGDASSQAEQHRIELAARKPFRDFEQPFAGSDGQPRVVAIAGVPRFDAAGVFLGYRGTAQLRSNRTAESRSEGKVPAGEILARLGVPIFVKDAGLRFLFTNQAFADLFGTRPEAMQGRRLSEFVSPRLAHRLESAENAVLLTGSPCALALSLPAQPNGEQWSLREWRLQSRGTEPLIIGCMAAAAQPQSPQSQSEPAKELPQAVKRREQPLEPFADLAAARVVIVGQDPGAGADLARELTGRGLDACAAKDAAEAVSLIKAVGALGLRVDCVVLDDRLPGSEIAQIIRAANGPAAVPITLVRAQEQPDDLLRSLAATVRQHRARLESLLGRHLA